MKGLTFKQYLDSREQLLNAIRNTPISLVEYEVKNYCSLTLGEHEDDRIIVGLRPKNKIIVEWHYDDINNPTPVKISFQGVKSTDDAESFETFWSGQKLQKWLARHAHEGVNDGHKI